VNSSSQSSSIQEVINSMFNLNQQNNENIPKTDDKIINRQLRQIKSTISKVEEILNNKNLKEDKLNIFMMKMKYCFSRIHNILSNVDGDDFNSSTLFISLIPDQVREYFLRSPDLINKHTIEEL